MTEVILVVSRTANGWAVEGDGIEALHFQSGGHAESHAQAVARSLWKQGTPARVVIYGPDGALVGQWRHGPSAGPIQ